MGNSLHYIYFFVAILVGLYFFITNKYSRKPLFMLLLSMLSFYSSAYFFLL